MDPLDLRLAPPRAPKAELAGLAFLPRSIDKVRATFEGGNLGAYQIEGFTEQILEKIGITVEDFTRTVREAASEADVAAYVTAHAKPEGITEWNTYLHNRVIFNGDRAAAELEFPFLRRRPDIVLSVDLLAEEDRRLFEAC